MAAAGDEADDIRFAEDFFGGDHSDFDGSSDEDDNIAVQPPDVDDDDVPLAQLRRHVIVPLDIDNNNNSDESDVDISKLQWEAAANVSSLINYEKESGPTCDMTGKSAVDFFMLFYTDTLFDIIDSNEGVM